MNTKGFKQMLIGEKMPDKDDPKYKERYERDVRAGSQDVQNRQGCSQGAEICRLA